MRVLGGGRDRADGLIAGVVAFLGCVVGNVLAVVMTVANHQHMPPAETLGASIAVLTHPVLAYRLLAMSFSIMDVLFYAIAIYAGYRTAMKPPVPEPAAQPAVSGTSDAQV
jgi:ABC-type lipoprotein release transport system permease subunit